MSVIGLAMVRDEADVIEHTVRHMLAQDLDLVVVADNLSTDGTREILDAIVQEGYRLVVVDDPDPAYRQSEKMTEMANTWATTGDWVVPFDADELWGVRGRRTLADALKLSGASVVAGKPWVHVPTMPRGHIDCPFEAMPDRMPVQETWPKAALKWSEGLVIEQGNHWTKSPVADALDIRHFQYRSLEHMKRKVRNGTEALELADLPADSGAHWRQMATLSDATLRQQWYDYTNQPLVFDPPTCLACGS